MCFNNMLYFFFMGQARINFMCHFSSIPDEVIVYEVLNLELLFEWFKNSEDVDVKEPN